MYGLEIVEGKDAPKERKKNLMKKEKLLRYFYVYVSLFLQKEKKWFLTAAFVFWQP